MPFIYISEMPNIVQYLDKFQYLDKLPHLWKCINNTYNTLKRCHTYSWQQLKQMEDIKYVKIINKHTGKKTFVNYRIWKSEILDKGLCVNYKLLGEFDLVDIFEIKSKTKREYIETTDRNYAVDKYASDDKYLISNTDMSRFDSNYIELSNPYLENQSKKLFLSRILRYTVKTTKAIDILTKNPIVSLIIGTLIVYAIMKYILKWI